MNRQLTHEYQQQIRSEFNTLGIADDVNIVILPVPDGHFVGYLMNYYYQHPWIHKGMVCYCPIHLGSVIHLAFHNPLPITNDECSTFPLPSPL